MEEFGVEGFGVDISKEAISKGKKNAKHFGFDQLSKRLSVVKDTKFPFKNNFLELCRVTSRYIHLTLIASVSSVNSDFACDTIVKSNHEYGTVQSYYNLEKINNLLGKRMCNKIIYNRKVSEIDMLNDFIHARYHVVIDLLYNKNKY